MKLNKRFLVFSISFLVLLLVFFVLTFSDQGFYEYYQNKINLIELENRIDSLKKVNDSLSYEIELLKSNPGKIEKVAREKYGMIKPGEKVYKIEILE